MVRGPRSALPPADAETVGGSDQSAQHFNEPAAFLLRSNRDAQKVLDARLSEMPDQNAARAKRGREIGSAPASMTREHEVRERRQHLEAELSEIACQAFAARDDTVAGLLEPPVVLDGGDGAGDGEAIDG